MALKGNLRSVLKTGYTLQPLAQGIAESGGLIAEIAGQAESSLKESHRSTAALLR